MLGTCDTCNILGCPDRTKLKDSWRISDRSRDQFKREEDRDNPIFDYENDLRRAEISACKRLRAGGIYDTEKHRGPLDRYSTSTSEEKGPPKHEYIIRLQYHYDVTPSTKYTKELTVYDTGWEEANTQALNMYPNSILLNSHRRK